MDTVVLNLTEDDPGEPSRQYAKVKGGRWTDRLKAKRGTKRKVSWVDNKSAAHLKPFSTQRNRPEKRRRAEEGSVEQHAVLSVPPRAHTQVISSLFTSNPTIATPSKQSSLDPNIRPSNAPLHDSSSFSSLGLDPLLVSHLETKMNISKPTSVQQSALSTLLPTVSGSTQPPDVFIQSQTGSGKTLSFLLPIVQDLLPLSALSYIDRSIGTLAIILAPTRELAQQISAVLEALLQMRLRPEGEDVDESSTRLTRWLVSGLLIGGATRSHEKARLRKGVPILVCTPGRLLDHLQNTSSFDVGKCRWLVFDEADRLLDLGFEETVTGVIQSLEGRRKLALQAAEQGIGMDVRNWNWQRSRSTILCSATIRDDVQRLAGMALRDPIIIKATASDPSTQASSTPKFTAPSQLAQKYVICPLKLRLVLLVALLRTFITDSTSTKILVFFSSTDSVDFHWQLLTGCTMADSGNEEDTEYEAAREVGTSLHKSAAEGRSSLFPKTSLFHLHGSLSTQQRLEVLKLFSTSSLLTGPSIMFCTSVASRGLDLPLVQAVVQYDLPTEGGSTEYLHRVGRTARAGKGGEAWSFLVPTESGWVPWIESSIAGKGSSVLSSISFENILQTGFGGAGKEYQERATDVQLSFERWVLGSKTNGELAKRAFLSHMRAYSTHPLSEKHIFHLRNLHLGHLAKSFALRDAPKHITAQQRSNKHTFRTRTSFNANNSSVRRKATKSNTSKSRQLQLARNLLHKESLSEYHVPNTDALKQMLS